MTKEKYLIDETSPEYEDGFIAGIAHHKQHIDQGIEKIEKDLTLAYLNNVYLVIKDIKKLNK